MNQKQEAVIWDAIHDALEAMDGLADATDQQVIDWIMRNRSKLSCEQWFKAHQSGIAAILAERRWSRWAASWIASRSHVSVACQLKNSLR